MTHNISAWIIFMRKKDITICSYDFFLVVMSPAGKVWVFGKIETGKISKGDTVWVMPGKTPVEITEVANAQRSLKTARAGESVRVAIKGGGAVKIRISDNRASSLFLSGDIYFVIFFFSFKTGIDEEQIHQGFVLCDPKAPVHCQ